MGLWVGNKGAGQGRESRKAGRQNDNGTGTGAGHEGRPAEGLGQLYPCEP